MIIVFQGSIDFVGFVQRARVHWKYIATHHGSHFPAAGSSFLRNLSDNGSDVSYVSGKRLYFILIESAISLFLSGMNERNNEKPLTSFKPRDAHFYK